MSKMGNYVQWCMDKGYTDENGDVDNMDHVDEYMSGKPKSVKAFIVSVKWTGTIAVMEVEARDAQQAQELANKRLDMESNGLIHFDVKEVM